jgi:phage terminase large subunit GpA-like protein
MISEYPFYEGLSSVLRPKPLIDVAEWAEQKRILPASGSSSPGPWRNSRTPYLVEVMKHLSPQSKTKEIAFMKGSQVGATESATNFLLYNMDQRGGSFLSVMPTESDAIKLSKQRITPSIEAIESIRSKMQKRTGNSLLEKVYTGGIVIMSGSNSPSALASMPIGNAIADEIDRYNISKSEGDPLELIRARLATFPNAKLFCLSTPTLKSTSNIYRLYMESTQNIYKVQCPHCHEVADDDGYFEIKMDQLRWEKGKYDEVLLYCPHCGTGIEEYQKTKMLETGKWVEQNPGHPRVGFFLSSLYSPIGWLSWSTIARKFDECGNDPERLQTFTNTILGLPWEETGETIAQEYLTRRIEHYNAQVPNEVLQLTMAVDVQKTWLEYEVCGWARGEESWGIEHGKIEGPTTELDSGNIDFPSVWKQLDEVRKKDFTREDGYVMRISCVMVDSGGIGSTTDTVYAYTLPRENQRVFAIKGSSQSSKPIFNKHTRTRNGCALFAIGVDKAKQLIYDRLRIEEAGPGHCHFPSHEAAGYNADYFAGLISECRRFRWVKGYKKFYWWKPRDARNEPLDLRVYNLNAIRLLNPNWDVLENRYARTRKIDTPPTVKKSAVAKNIRRTSGIRI